MFWSINTSSQCINNAPNLEQQSLSIVHPNLKVGFELKSLPIFKGLGKGEPIKHLKEFYINFSIMKSIGITKEKVRAFLFTLVDYTKEWLYYLPFGFIGTLNEMKRQFFI